jgi:hypothetical protein
MLIEPRNGEVFTVKVGSTFFNIQANAGGEYNRLEVFIDGKPFEVCYNSESNHPEHPARIHTEAKRLEVYKKHDPTLP